MRPLDPRLLRYARSTKVFLGFAILIGVLTAVLIIVQARLLSGVIVDVTSNGATWDDVSDVVFILLLVFALRGLLAWLAELAAYRTSSTAKSELRQAALERALHGVEDPGEVTALITRGVDALDGYFSRYLPQLVLAVVVPIAVILTVLGQDLLSTIIIVVTLPLIPVFMILIGMYTKTRVEKQWHTLAALSGHFLDLIAGLPTLKVLGRAKAQAAAIQAMGDRYRSTTMGVLRVSFLSSLALELLATLSVALVAVSVGLRLAEGQLSYSVALFVLLLAPEAYLPLRLVGQHFHAAAEGLGAAEKIFVLIESPDDGINGSTVIADVSAIEVRNVTFTYPERDVAAISRLNFAAQAGDVVAIVGPSGSGKSTLVELLLGRKQPSSGEILINNEVALADCDCRSWHAQCSWVPQHPQLVAPGETRSIRNVVALGVPNATDDLVEDALRRANVLDEILASPAGLATLLAADGSGFSAGQLRRIAIARALIVGAPILILDEPTAALDATSEHAIISTLSELRAGGGIVLVVAHRPAVLEIASLVVRMGPALTPPQPHPSLVTNQLSNTAGGW